MNLPMLLLPVIVLAQGKAEDEPVYFDWGGHSVVMFCCDFSHYPPKGNVGISLAQCDYAIFADEHPHLRLTTAEKSRFAMKFSLPEAPKAAFLDVVHLASADAQGSCESPVSIAVKLQKGENTMEWRAGKLRTHYWLRKAEVEVAFQAPVEVRLATPEVEHALFWEGRFDQCSYNALATVLDHFYGVEGWNSDRESYEKRVFVSALDKFGLGGYFGWAPWTSYMVQAGTIRWNGRPVTDLKAERFSLRTKAIPTPQGREMLVRYDPGEKATLVKALRARLEKGPIIIWTPYAAAMRGGEPWRQVRSVDPAIDAVRFSPNMTHSVVVNLEKEKVKVYDNSWPWGVWVVEPETIVATAAAMVGSVRVDRGGGKTLLSKGFGGVENDQYNVVFWKE